MSIDKDFEKLTQGIDELKWVIYFRAWGVDEEGGEENIPLALCPSIVAAEDVLEAIDLKWSSQENHIIEWSWK